MTTIYTLGHSNRSAEELLATLHQHDIRCLIDIRAFPRSRRNPQFSRASLSGTLSAADISYRWLGDTLGGFRKPHRDSPNSALTDASFRGYADHMRSDKFVQASASLITLANGTRTAMMCAEADYHHCHRQFIADYLQQQGVTVMHIINQAALAPHTLHACLDPASDPPVYNKHEQRDLFGES